jgi:hypothetical protein
MPWERGDGKAAPAGGEAALPEFRCDSLRLHFVVVVVKACV